MKENCDPSQSLLQLKGIYMSKTDQSRGRLTGALSDRAIKWDSNAYFCSHNKLGVDGAELLASALKPLYGLESLEARCAA